MFYSSIISDSLITKVMISCAHVRLFFHGVSMNLCVSVGNVLISLPEIQERASFIP